MERGDQELKRSEDEGVWVFVAPPLALYKGARWGLGRPAQPTKTQEEQATGTGLLPRPAMARFPASTVRNSGCMEAAWLACRTEVKDEANPPPPPLTPGGREPHGRAGGPRGRVGPPPPPRPMIVGSGRLRNRASAPSS